MKKIIFIFIAFLFGIKGVKAYESKLEFINGIHYTMSVNDNLGSYYHSYNQAYIKIDGNLVYCLDPTKIIYDNLNYVEGISTLNPFTLNTINLIGHYGYNYYNHNNYRYYLAAQELIWQIIRPKIEIKWFNEATNLDLTKEKEEIMYLVNNHLSKPSFDNQTFNLNQNEELILEDDILSLYEVISINNSIVRKEGNKLIINKAGTNKEQVILKKIIKYDYLETKHFVSDNYQNLILPRVNDEVISTINLENNYGSVSISKVDSESGLMYSDQGANLKGSKYNLYDADMNLVKEFIYDKDYYNIYNLPFGTYYLKEIENSVGYLKDDTTYTIKIEENSRCVSLSLKGELIKAKLIINNLYGDLRLKEDSTFMIGDIKLDVKDGIGEIVLKYGSYNVRQVSTINNHILSEEFIIEVQNTNDIEYTIINEETKGKIDIYSVDNLNRIIENDFTYKLFNSDKNEYIKLNNSECLRANKGVLSIDDLSLGNYVIEYSSSEVQYEPVTTKMSFEITGSNSVNFKYKEAYQSIVVNILDNLGQEVNSSSIELYCAEDIYFSKNRVCSKDKKIISLDMNDYYLMLSDFIKGKYYIIQTKVDDKYILNKDKYYIDLSIDNTITIINQLKVEEKIEDTNVEEDVPKVINSTEEEKSSPKESNNIAIPKVLDRIVKDNLLNEEEYVKIPNTGVRIFKINGLFILMILFMGYIVVRYAKE